MIKKKGTCRGRAQRPTPQTAASIIDEKKRRKSSDSRRKNELLTKNLTKLTNKAFKHISAGKFSEREVRSRFDTPRVSDADSDEFKDNLREI